MSEAARRVIAPLASLRLTVVLFAMSVFIVFAGTVAQIDKGIWTVVNEYFRCSVAWIDLQIFFPRAWNVPGGFFFPGGWLIGAVLLANILAAHGIRFKIQAVGTRLMAGWLVLAAGGVLTYLIAAGVFNKDIAATEEDAFWRVLLRLGKGGGVAVLLLVGCILVFKKRAGIVLLHSGVVILLLSEIITGLWAVEGRMRIKAGESKNYVENTRSIELAFTDRSDAEFDQVLAVPSKLLSRNEHISDDKLPFDIEVLTFMKNSRLINTTRVGPDTKNPATAGTGLRLVAQPRPEVSGTDASQSIDAPSAYIKLLPKGGGDPLGTYLVSLWLDLSGLPQQSVEVAGTTYDLSMRLARDYKPYSIELIEFRHDKYVGTETPRNFSSLVRVVDEEKNIDRTVTIWMNNPLRYAGETFYQSSFEPGKNLTILQVVRNRGWMLPYLACMIVGVGLAVHLGTQLTQFLRRGMPI